MTTILGNRSYVLICSIAILLLTSWAFAADWPHSRGKDFKPYRYERLNPETGEPALEKWVKCEKPDIRAGCQYQISFAIAPRQ